jgi:hypothetical protein
MFFRFGLALGKGIFLLTHGQKSIIFTKSANGQGADQSRQSRFESNPCQKILPRWVNEFLGL